MNTNQWDAIGYPMYIESVPNRSSPPAILLRESFRQDGRVRKRTLANLSDWPTSLVEGFRTLLKGGLAVAEEGIRIRRALPHGHAAAVLGTIRRIRPRPAARQTDRQAPRSAGDRLDRQPADLAGLQTGHRARPRRRHRRLEPGLAVRASARSTRSSSTALLTGSASVKPRSKPRSPAAISKTAHWSSTMSPPPGWRADAASWRALATRATARRASCRSSMACYARPTAAR